MSKHTESAAKHTPGPWAIDDFMSSEDVDDLVDFVCAPLATLKETGR